ncbi:MAG: hypothetical protein HYY43_05885, partial [Deltaproteobacteria bacterium]|nr:hypothetical protein [Deltaproteobacteria bacterium]
MGNDKNVCLNKQQAAVIDNFFGEMLVGNPNLREGLKETTFGGMAGDPSQVCYDDVVAAIDYFERGTIYQGQGHRSNFSFEGFESKLESLYYKEGGEAKKPPVKWYGDLWNKRAERLPVLTKEDAALTLWKHVRGYASLSDTERRRVPMLDSVREDAIKALRQDAVAEGIEKLSDDELCKFIVNKMSADSHCAWRAYAGYYLVYLDAKKRYQREALSYIFGANYNPLTPSQMQEALAIYGMLTPTAIKALYKKYPDAPLSTWVSFFKLKGLNGLYLEMLKDKRYGNAEKENAVKALIKNRDNSFVNSGEENYELALGVIEYAHDKGFFINYLARYNRDGKYNKAIVGAVIRYGFDEKYLEGTSPDLATLEAIYKDVPKAPIAVWRYFRTVEGIDKFYRKLLDSNAYSKEEKYELISKLWNKELFKYALENHLDIFTPKQACELLAHQTSETAPNAETIRKIALNSETPLASIGNVEFIPEALLIELAAQGSEPFAKRLQFVLEHKWSDPSVQERLWTELIKGKSEVEIFSAVAGSNVKLETTAKAIDLIRSIIVPAIKGRDGEKVNRLFGWIGDGRSYFLADSITDIITKECTPDDIVWLSDIQNASDFVKRHLAGSLAEVYLREGDFVKLFGISSHLYFAGNDFWKRLFASVIQHRDNPGLEHVLCLDVALTHAGDDFWAVTNTERDKNISDATVMISNHLEGEGPKFYYSKGYEVGRGICSLLGEDLLKKAIGMMKDRDSAGAVKERDGDGVILLRRVLEYYAYQTRNLFYPNRRLDYPVDDRGEAFFDLMKDYFTNGLPELLVFGKMDEDTRKSLVESNAFILSTMLKYGAYIDRPHEARH